MVGLAGNKFLKKKLFQQFLRQKLLPLLHRKIYFFPLWRF